MDYSKLGLDANLVDAVKAITEASCSSKKMEKEELHPNQKKLDKNKNGKLDADDFKMLRKEEEQTDENYVSNAQRKAVWASKNEKGVKEETELEEAKDTVEKDAAGKVKSWSHEGDWKKSKGTDGRGKVANLSDKARKATEKMTNEQLEEYMMSEDFEQLDELSKATLANYAQRAAHDVGNKMYGASSKRAMAVHHDSKGDEKLADYYGKEGAKDHSKALTRLQGIKTAAKKLAKEDVEQIDELSKKTLGSYVKQASNDMADKQQFAQAAHMRGDETERHGLGDAEMRKSFAKHDYDKSKKLMSTAVKRRQGISKALNKLTKEQYEEIEALAAKHGLTEE